ncbi:MAG: TIGR04282 family arsenosugar biosynthesis glycosyltransferase [Candidatus Electrothrix sp.]
MNDKRSQAQQSVIVLFTRYPQAGKVKTRLIKHLGPQGAADLHSRMTKQVIRRLRPALTAGSVRSVQLQVYYCGGTKQEIQTWLGSDIPLARQQGNDLGERMQYAFEQTWQQGPEKVLLIGSDCPGMNPAIITSGLEYLQQHDLVLGPASDGGYYLIGLSARLKKEKRNYADLFQNIDWGTDQVLAQTLIRAHKNNLSFALLPQLHDIDRPEDLVHLNYYTNPE